MRSQEAGVAAGRIAIELDYMPAQDYIRLRERLPKATFVPCKDLYFAARMIKTDEEVAILRKVGELTDRVAGEVLREIKPGMTEKAVGQIITNKMMDGGCDGLKVQVGSGIRSGITNCTPTDKQIEKGDVVRVEILGDMNHYRSNVTRTAVVGEPTDEQKQIWEVMIGAREACKALLKPGLAVADLYRTYVNYLHRPQHRADAQVSRPWHRPDHPRGALHHRYPHHRDGAEHHLHDGAALHDPRPHGLPRRGHVPDHSRRLRADHRHDHAQRRADPDRLSPMKIAAIETFVVSLPVRRPHTWAGNFSPPGRGYVVLKLTLEDGTVGWGEAQVLKDWGGEYGTRSGESHETTTVVVARAAGADR